MGKSLNDLRNKAAVVASALKVLNPSRQFPRGFKSTVEIIPGLRIKQQTIEQIVEHKRTLLGRRKSLSTHKLGSRANREIEKAAEPVVKNEADLKNPIRAVRALR